MGVCPDLPPFNPAAKDRLIAGTECLEQAFLDRPPHERLVGIEYEFPLVSRDGKAAPARVTQELFSELVKNGWLPVWDGPGGIVRGVRHPGGLDARGEPGQHAYDIIKTDAGHCILEIALAPQPGLLRSRSRLEEVLGEVCRAAGALDACLLGFGMQPLSRPQRALMIPLARYRLLERQCGNTVVPPEAGNDFHLYTLCAAAHVHIEVCREEALRALNLFNQLSGLLIMLGSNSPVWMGRLSGFAATRQRFYDWAWRTRADQTGVLSPVSSFQDYFLRLCAMRPVLVERAGQPLDISHIPTFAAYLSASETGGAVGVGLDGKPRSLTPSLEDLVAHASFAWFDTRLCPKHGTVEIRSFCQQPPGSLLAPAALALGIVENLAAAEALAQRCSFASWRALRDAAVARGFGAVVQGNDSRALAEKLLDIAEAGLAARARGEQAFLTPFRQCLATGKNGADMAREAFLLCGVPGLLETLKIQPAPLPSPAHRSHSSAGLKGDPATRVG